MKELDYNRETQPTQYLPSILPMAAARIYCTGISDPYSINLKETLKLRHTLHAAWQLLLLIDYLLVWMLCGCSCNVSPLKY